MQQPKNSDPWEPEIQEILVFQLKGVSGLKTHLA